MLKTLQKTGLLAILMVGSVSAHAQSYSHESYCSSVFSSVQSGYLDLGYARDHHPECFSASNGNQAQDVIRATSLIQAQAISNVVGSRFTNVSPTQVALSNSTGMAAGNASKWFVWSNMAINSDLKYSHEGFNTDSDILNGTLGADYQLAPNMVLGLSLGFDNGKGTVTNDKTFNLARIDTSGQTLAPYFGWQITPLLTLDLAAGLGRGKFDQDNTSTAHSDRYFGATNLTYTQWLGNLQVTGKGGYIYAVEKYDDTKLDGSRLSGTGATNRLGQLRLGGQVGYWVTGGVMPYLGLTYTSDLERTSVAGQPWDKDALLLTLGVNAIAIQDGLTLGLVLNKEYLRTKSENQSLMLNLNLRF